MRGKKQPASIRRRRSGSLNSAGEANEEWDYVESGIRAHIQPRRMDRGVHQELQGQVSTSTHYIVLPKGTDVQPDDRIYDENDNSYVVEKLEPWRSQIEAYCSITDVQ